MSIYIHIPTFQSHPYFVVEENFFQHWQRKPLKDKKLWWGNGCGRMRYTTLNEKWLEPIAPSPIMYNKSITLLWRPRPTTDTKIRFLEPLIMYLQQRKNDLWLGEMKHLNFQRGKTEKVRFVKICITQKEDISTCSINSKPFFFSVCVWECAIW